MPDQDFAAEVRQHRAARWQVANLDDHVDAHRRDFLEAIGQPLSKGELEILSGEIRQAWDRLFTELEHTGAVSYVFVRVLPDPDHAILVVTRGGRVRSTFPTRHFSRWRGRHPAAIEVTDRAKRLEL